MQHGGIEKVSRSAALVAHVVDVASADGDSYSECYHSD